MRYALFVAAALALPAQAARDCEPNCEMLWTKYTAINLTAMDTGSPESATWRTQFDHQRHDIRIEVDTPGPQGRMRGTIVLVEGRVLMSRGLDLPRNAEISAVDAPILAIKLVAAVLGRAVPVAPEAIVKERVIQYKEPDVGIRFATPTASGNLAPPWTADGKLTRSGKDIVFDLRLTGNTTDPSGRKGPVIDTRFIGRFSNVAPPILDDAMSLATWTVYGTHSMEMSTIADVRAAIAQAIRPGAPDPTKNFTGMWKRDCSQQVGLQIKPIGNEGMYSVSYCSQSGCWEPGTFRPNTFISGDPHYKVATDSAMQIEEPGGFVSYQKCSSDPEPAR